MSSRKVTVSISLDEETFRVGILWFHVRKGRESAAFEYDVSWLEHPERFALEPALQLTTGSFHTDPGIPVFGAVSDSAPDRWGRALMRREEAAKTKRENTTAATLFEMDYLLGVNDEARQGALRFSSEGKEDIYLAPKDKAATPPLMALSKLLSATERFIAEDESAEDMRQLLAPGSSLGGARPKASVRDQDGSLAIAKFPSKDDEFNMIAWEAVTLSLAQQARIAVPAWRIKTVLNKPVLIIKRFDRNAGLRIPFLSAMSMLGARDNEQHSYLDISYALTQHGASPEQDMAQLWRRIIFNVMIANTDDHLRNHGFIYERHRGWRLSPAYDMNPTPVELRPRTLTTAIDSNDATTSIEKARTVAGEFRISDQQAESIIREVSGAVSQWRAVAARHGLSKRECDRMASAFAYEGDEH